MKKKSKTQRAQSFKAMTQAFISNRWTVVLGFTGDGFTSLAMIYASFSLSNWFAPSVVALLGPKLTMVAGKSLIKQRKYVNLCQKSSNRGMKNDFRWSHLQSLHRSNSLPKQLFALHWQFTFGGWSSNHLDSSRQLSDPKLRLQLHVQKFWNILGNATDVHANRKHFCGKYHPYNLDEAKKIPNLCIL